jgi:hypothetical protein
MSRVDPLLEQLVSPTRASIPRFAAATRASHIPIIEFLDESSLHWCECSSDVLPLQFIFFRLSYLLFHYALYMHVTQYS